MKKKKPGVEGVVEIPGTVRRTNRFYITLRGYGHCDENGRSVMGIECSSKKIPAPPDRPLALMAGIINELLPVMKYSSSEATEKDLAEFKEYVTGLHLAEKKGERRRKKTPRKAASK